MKRSKGMKTMTLMAAVMAAMSLAACGGEKTEGNVTQSTAEESVAAQEVGSTEAKETEQEMQSVGEVTMDTLLAHAETPAEDFAYDIYDEHVWINGYKGTDPIVVIPEEIEGYPVTEVSDLRDSGIEAIKFSDSVEIIRDSCFLSDGFVTGENPEILKIVVMGENLKKIGKIAFEGCESLETVILNENLESIGEAAFQFTALKELHLPSSVTEIGVGMAENSTVIYVKAGSYAEEEYQKIKEEVPEITYVVE